MANWNMFFVVVVVAALGLVDGQREAFLGAFPHANMELFDQLPPYVFEDQPNVNFSTPTLAACPSIPAPPDTDNVNNLRPGNIRVVMAMGDSITAGMSAKDTNVLSLKEYRGLAYSIGGDKGLITFPNILAPFLPAGQPPIGFSTGIGSRTSSGNGLNAAVSGAINSDMLGQAQWLVQQLKANSKINFANDWKVLTIWIGSNNLCDVCDNINANNGANFQKSLNDSLSYLYSNVPRLFVNLVGNLEISTLYNINSGACSLLHKVACGCVGSSNANSRAIVATTGKDYQSRAYTIAKSFNGRSNSFAVVVQPFLIKTIISERSQLSAADCFHPSAIAHTYAAIGLWNNMLTPAASKLNTWDPSATPICPTSSSLFYTN